MEVIEINRIKELFGKANRKRYGIGLILFFAIIILLMGYFWIFSSNGKLNDLGLNAMTEVLSILVTIYWIDHLIYKQKEIEAKPRRMLAYTDTKRFISLITDFWQGVYMNVINGSVVPESDIVFDKIQFTIMERSINLNAETHFVFPEQKWVNYLMSSARYWDKFGSEILLNHASFLDQEDYLLIRNIKDNDFIQTLLNVDLLFRQRVQFCNTTTLYDCSADNKDLYDDIKKLLSKCNKVINNS